MIYCVCDAPVFFQKTELLYSLLLLTLLLENLINLIQTIRNLMDKAAKFVYKYYKL